MVDIGQGNVLGSSIEGAEITDGEISYSKLGTDLFKVKLLETLTYTANTTKTSGTLEAFNQYLVVFDVVPTIAGFIQARINGLSAGNYYYKKVDATALADVSGDSSWLIGRFQSGNRVNGLLTVGGLATVVSCGIVSFSGQSTGATADFILVGEYQHAGQTQTETMTFFASGGTLTGTIKIYGVE